MALSSAAADTYARPRAGTEQLGRTGFIEPAQSPAPPATLVVRGTIKNYDPISNLLLLTTPTGTLRLTIPPAVRIRQRWHSIDASALVKCAGFQAAVRYSESNGQKTVQSVHVFGKDEKLRGDARVASLLQPLITFNRSRDRIVLSERQCRV
jgi:hypothetical protein